MRAGHWLLSLVLALGSHFAFCEPTLRLKTGIVTLPPKQLRAELDGDLSTRREWVLQFSSVIPKDARVQLEAKGISVVGYLPENAYLVIAPGRLLSPFLSSPLIRAIVPFQPMWKNVFLSSKGSPAFGNQRHIFQVRVVNPSIQRAVLAKIKSGNLGRVLKTYSSGHLLLEGAASSIAPLAEIPGVEWVELAEGVQPHVFDPWNGRRTRNGRLFSPKATPKSFVESGFLSGFETGSKIINGAQAWERGLTGKGQLVTVGDTGLDSGNMGTLHLDVRRSCIGGAALQSSGEKSWADGNGHGTHVAGTVLGNGGASQGVLKGLAYEAYVFVQGMLLPTGGLSVPEDLNVLFGQAYEKGSRIHSDSWGGRGSFGEYDSNAADADTFLSQNLEMLILFSAGNSGVDANKDGIIDE
ncbi:MAG: S8 family serine peptidase, partial [Bdellovibrionales bacterium]|nr:S8 family serine peptidase [Bdellovibrionales bacterium]